MTELQISQFSTAILVWLGQEYHKRQWVMQFHIGAIRNNNSRMFRLLGADSGFDSIGDRMFAEPLSKLLDAMDKTNQLPKTILYCLNPRDNEVIGSMIGNFKVMALPAKFNLAQVGGLTIKRWHGASIRTTISTGIIKSICWYVDGFS